MMTCWALWAILVLMTNIRCVSRPVLLTWPSPFSPGERDMTTRWWPTEPAVRRPRLWYYCELGVVNVIPWPHWACDGDALFPVASKALLVKKFIGGISHRIDDVPVLTVPSVRYRYWQCQAWPILRGRGAAVDEWWSKNLHWHWWEWCWRWYSNCYIIRLLLTYCQSCRPITR